jgi:hypothetical protein
VAFRDNRGNSGALSGYGQSVLIGNAVSVDGKIGGTVSLRRSGFRTKYVTTANQGIYPQLFNLTTDSFTVSDSYFKPAPVGGVPPAAVVVPPDYQLETSANVSVYNPQPIDPTLGSECEFEPPKSPPQQTSQQLYVSCVEPSIIRNSGLNVRTSPSADAPTIDKLPIGTLVNIVSTREDENFVWVEISYNKNGYATAWVVQRTKTTDLVFLVNNTNGCPPTTPTSTPTLPPNTTPSVTPTPSFTPTPIPSLIDTVVPFNPDRFSERTLADCTANISNLIERERCWVHVSLIQVRDRLAQQQPPQSLTFRRLFHILVESEYLGVSLDYPQVEEWAKEVLARRFYDANVGCGTDGCQSDELYDYLRYFQAFPAGTASGSLRKILSYEVGALDPDNTLYVTYVTKLNNGAEKVLVNPLPDWLLGRQPGKFAGYATDIKVSPNTLASRAQCGAALIIDSFDNGTVNIFFAVTKENEFELSCII